MELTVNTIEYFNGKYTTGFKYELVNDLGQHASSKNGLECAIKNFMKKYKLTSRPIVKSGDKKVELV